MSEETTEGLRESLVAELEAFGVAEDYIKPHWSTTRLQQDILMHKKQKAAREALMASKMGAGASEDASE